MEQWKKVPGFEDRYEVSSEGRLKSYASRAPRIIASCPDPRGYIPVHLQNKEKGLFKRIWLHQLVAQVFIPNPQMRREINHKNGIKTDCRANNLEWVTRSQNIRHAYENGLVKHVGLRGEASNRTTMTNADVIEMRKSYEEREITLKELGANYGVSEGTAYRIIHRLSWSHI